jgi:hypothetical protein
MHTHTHTPLTNENVPVPLTNERKREKSAPHLRLETRAEPEMCLGIRNEAAAIEKAAARDMLGERGSGSI